MQKNRIGKLPARYSFLLNPWNDIRLSKCPQCRRATHARKFPLLIHIHGWGPLVLGKTCRYCTPCELIIAHQDELEKELALNKAQLPQNKLGSDYFVVGTMDKEVWKQGLRAVSRPWTDMLEHVADFKKYLNLKVEGGWGPA